jgi:hypothetical protein
MEHINNITSQLSSANSQPSNNTNSNITIVLSTLEQKALDQWKKVTLHDLNMINLKTITKQKTFDKLTSHKFNNTLPNELKSKLNITWQAAKSIPIATVEDSKIEQNNILNSALNQILLCWINLAEQDLKNIINDNTTDATIQRLIQSLSESIPSLIDDRNQMMNIISEIQRDFIQYNKNKEAKNKQSDNISNNNMNNINMDTDQGNLTETKILSFMETIYKRLNIIDKVIDVKSKSSSVNSRSSSVNSRSSSNKASSDIYHKNNKNNKSNNKNLNSNDHNNHQYKKHNDNNNYKNKNNHNHNMNQYNNNNHHYFPDKPFNNNRSNKPIKNGFGRGREHTRAPDWRYAQSHGHDQSDSRNRQRSSSSKNHHHQKRSWSPHRPQKDFQQAEEVGRGRSRERY